MDENGRTPAGIEFLLQALPKLQERLTVLDRDMNVLYSNAERFHKPDELNFSHECHRFHQGNDEACSDCLAVRALSSRDAVGAEVMTDDGLWFDVRVTPLLDDDDDVVAFLRTERDVTALRGRLQTLEESDRLYHMILDHSRDIIFMLDSQWTCVYISPSYGRFFGAENENPIGQRLDFLIHSHDRGRTKRAFGNIAAGDDELESIELRVRHSINGWQWFSVTGSPLFDNDGEFAGVVGVSRWIDDRKKAEMALRHANRQLNLLTGMTRHDLRNQLQALYGYLSLMREDRSLRDDATIEKLLAIAERMSGQIEFTSIYQQIGSQDPLWQLLDDVLPPASEFGKAAFNNQAKGLEIYTDPMLGSVFHNLLQNSLQHGCTVSSISLSCRRKGRTLVIEWRDDGVGIPHDMKERIFDKGYGRNTGMGLFLSREILSMTGMGIKETGEPGEGACFQISVPRGRYRMKG